MKHLNLFQPFKGLIIYFFKLIIIRNICIKLHFILNQEQKQEVFFSVLVAARPIIVFSNIDMEESRCSS